MDTHYFCGTCQKRLTSQEIVPQAVDGRVEPCCPDCRTPCRAEPASAEPAPGPLRMIRRPAPPSSAPAAPAAAVPPPVPAPASAPASQPPPLPPAAPSAGLRFKAGGEPEKSSAPPGSEAPAELVQRVQQSVAAKMEKEREREARVKRNPWAAFLFPLQPLSVLAILLMLIIFSGIKLLLDIGFADEEPRKTDKAAQDEEPAAHAPVSILQSETAGSGEILVKSGGKTRVVATTEDIGAEDSRLGYRKDEANPREEEPAEEEGWITRYLNSGPYERSRHNEETGELDPEAVGGPTDFLFPGLFAMGFGTLIMFGFLSSYFSAILLNIIYETGNGLDRFPRWPNPLDIIDSCLVPTRNFLLCLALSFGPCLVAFIAPFYFPQFLRLVWLSAPILLLLGILYFPMSLMCVAVRGEGAGVLPSVVLPALAKAHIHYVPAMLAFLLVPAWPWISEIFLAEHLRVWQRMVVDEAMHITLLVVVMRALGLLYRRIERKLAWNAFARA